MSRLDHWWYGRRRPLWWAAPLSAVYRLAGYLRALPYRRGWKAVYRAPVPVVVVGNISVGGTGKTPLTAWLAAEFKTAGLTPGIICRGYRGASEQWPLSVTPDSDAALCGDEAVLLARHAGVPVVAGPDRPAAIRHLLDSAAVDVVLIDDGLQNPGFARDVELVVLDAARGLGNGALLPVGPLRELPQRLHKVDAVVTQGGRDAGRPGFVLRPRQLCRLDGRSSCAADAFAGETVHAVAGIGHPQRFFSSLETLGYEPIPHAFPDHHRFTAADFSGWEDARILMTEKDAVKCAGLGLRDAWYLEVHVQPDDALRKLRDDLIQRLVDG